MGINKSKFNLDDIEFNIDTPTNITKKYCQKCGTENEIESKFCLECGNTKFYDSYEEYEDKKNSKYCIHCKNKLSIKIKFCPDCGNNEFVNSKEELIKLENERKQKEWNAKISKAKKELNDLKNQEEIMIEENDDINNQIKDLHSKYQKEIKLIEASIEQYKAESNYDKANYTKQITKLTKEKESLVKKHDDAKTKYEKELALESDKYNNLINNNKDLENKIDELSKSLEQIKKEELAYEKARKEKEEKELNIKQNNGIYVDKKNKQVIFGKYCNEEILWNILQETTDNYFLISNKCLGECNSLELYTELRHIYNCFNQTEKDRLIPFRKYSKNISYIDIFSHDELIKYISRKEKRICTDGVGSIKGRTINGNLSWWIHSGKEIVNGSGNIVDIHSNVIRYGVRPIIKIKK